MGVVESGKDEIENLLEQGLLGDDVLGSGRRLSLDIFTSPGGYILGEETALLECMEGHRGEPRNKPPFPGNYGLHGRPTLINSVETFADVPVIVQRGAQWWCDQGAGDAVGWKFFAVSGHVERPDVYCVPMGTTVRELIELAGGVSGGREVGAVQPGGASSNFIGPDKLDMPLDFGAAATVPLDVQRTASLGTYSFAHYAYNGGVFTGATSGAPAARSGRPREATELLRHAFAHGLAHGLWLHTDADLAILRGDRDFEALIRAQEQPEPASGS